MFSDWSQTILLVLALIWAAYHFLRPSRDYYILRRSYFRRLHETPWRGTAESIHYQGFADYQAAKAAFDMFEGYQMNMSGDGNEAEHSLFLVPAKSKGAAISRLKGDKAYDKQLLNQTPRAEISRGRRHWAQAMEGLSGHRFTLAELIEKRD